MVLESCQILATVARDKYKVESMYRSAYRNHPCVKWTAYSDGNFLFLYSLAECLADEYTFRYDKIHKSTNILGQLQELKGKLAQKGGTFTTPYLAMPDDCKDKNAVRAYRNYYLTHKNHLLTYTRRKVPEWIKEKGLGVQK